MPEKLIDLKLQQIKLKKPLVNPMKNYLPPLLLVLLSINCSAQDFERKVAIEICNCVDTIENMDSLDSKVDKCAYDALETTLENASEEVQDIFSSDDEVEEVITNSMRLLLSECPKIRKFIITDRKSRFYRMSSSQEANRLYEYGNRLVNADSLKYAISQYKKAVSIDPQFVYALDNLGLTYRRLGNNRKAVSYYAKSLTVYPEGNFALQNIAVAYTGMKDYDRALSFYNRVLIYYPDDAEGYYGIGRLYYLQGEYEKSLDYLFIAHKIYVQQKSDFAADTEKLLADIYNKLKSLNKTDLFNQKAGLHGISVN
jgi:tetratricopeptide (TPR) repeat protein